MHQSRKGLLKNQFIRGSSIHLYEYLSCSWIILCKIILSNYIDFDLCLFFHFQVLLVLYYDLDFVFIAAEYKYLLTHWIFISFVICNCLYLIKFYRCENQICGFSHFFCINFFGSALFLYFRILLSLKLIFCTYHVKYGWTFLV